jgi:DNA-directed RNA polymerase subunit K/omega
MAGILSYKSAPFEESSKVLSSLSNPKISKLIMTKYEFDQIISVRTNQLARGAISFVKITEDIKRNMDLRKIALQELMEGKLPFIIKRPLPNNKYEYVRINELNLVAVKYLMH